jgi:hydrogenase/urease accessory protein HupE
MARTNAMSYSMSYSMIKRMTLFTMAAWLVLACSQALADEIRPAFLQITEVSSGRFEVFWKVPALESERRLALTVVFDGNASIGPDFSEAFVGDAHIQRWTMSRPSGFGSTDITIDGLSAISTEVLLRIEKLDGSSILHRFTPDADSYLVAEDQSIGQVIWTYTGLGIEHILIGIDHLLFVLALLMLVPNTRKLIATITAFTVAHSITLSLAALNIIDVPIPPVEACIALSIVFLSAEIVHGYRGKAGVTARWPWLVAFTFGLLHGLGFAAALAEIGMPQSAVPVALLFFNVGVEVGQLIFIAAVLAIVALFKVALKQQGVGIMPTWPRQVFAYGIGSVASFWVVERVAAFWT